MIIKAVVKYSYGDNPVTYYSKDFTVPDMTLEALAELANGRGAFVADGLEIKAFEAGNFGVQVVGDNEPRVTAEVIVPAYDSEQNTEYVNIFTTGGWASSSTEFETETSASLEVYDQDGTSALSDGDTIDFGNVTAAGATYGYYSISIKNAGGRGLEIVSVAIGGTDAADFDTVADLPSLVRGGDTVIQSLSFDPGSAAVKAGTLTLTYNDGSGSNKTFGLVLAGTGT